MIDSVNALATAESEDQQAFFNSRNNLPDDHTNGHLPQTDVSSDACQPAKLFSSSEDPANLSEHIHHKATPGAHASQSWSKEEWMQSVASAILSTARSLPLPSLPWPLPLPPCPRRC